MKNSFSEQKKGKISADDSHILFAVQETLNGKRRAFSLIVEQYTPLFYSLAVRMLGKNDEAEEALQEIFLKVFKSLNKFSLGKRFFPWIYTIALNHLRSVSKKIKRRKKAETIYIEEASLLPLHNALRNEPSAMYIRNESESMAQKALLMLKPRYREVFILREIAGLSVKQVAEIVKKPEGTIKTHLHRAKKILMELLIDKL